MDRVRDIDYLLVTGAGASCSFGVNGARIPMMGEWADALVKKLAGASNGYLKATGLSTGLAAIEFEQRLGAFLHQVAAFSEVEQLVASSRDFLFETSIQNLVAPVHVLESWHETTKHHLGQVVELIRESLYELFADPSVDLPRAAEAYEALFEQLGITQETSWVYATTNNVFTQTISAIN